MDVLIRAIDLSKTIGGKLLFENTSFEVLDDNCIGVIGLNGCGKTTLFRILLKQVKADEGELWIKDNLKIRILKQTAIGMQDLTVRQFITQITDEIGIQQQIKEYEKQLENPAIYNSSKYEEILEKIQKLQLSIGQAKSNSHLKATIEILDDVSLGGLSPNQKIGVLSGGERQKLALASVLAQPRQCNLLLLDEPTNHLDIETIEWLEDQLADISCAVMMITHDRYLLDDLVDRVFDFQKNHINIFDTNYEDYTEQNRLSQHIQYQEYKKAKIKINKQKASIQKMSRRNRYDKQITSKIKRLEKFQHIENPVIKNYLLRFHFKTVFKSGKNIADSNGISKSFDEKTILDNVTFEIFSGQKIGLIGPNGCGKTTFLKILTGTEKPDSGALNVSRGVQWGYFDQGHLSLDLKNTLINEILKDHKELNENDAKALLGQFNFKGDKVNNSISQLSGGERARLAFLRLIMQPYNFLILDEPTNHMDMQSKKAIEGALNSFNGTVIVVSHDRNFLDNVTDTIFLMTDNAIKMYNGNYSMFRLQRQKELRDMTGKNLAYLSKSGLKKYVVKKSFTEWSTRTKHKADEIVYIGDHNEKLYEWPIKSGCLKLCDR